MVSIRIRIESPLCFVTLLSLAMLVSNVGPMIAVIFFCFCGFIREASGVPSGRVSGGGPMGQEGRQDPETQRGTPRLEFGYACSHFFYTEILLNM